MNAFEKKLALKRMELTAAHNDEERKWSEMQEAEKNFKNRWQKPWHDAREKEQSIMREVEILEGVIKEMEGA